MDDLLQASAQSADIAQELTATLTRIAQSATVLLKAPAIAFALRDGKDGVGAARIAFGHVHAQGWSAPFQPQQGIERWVATHREPVFIHDTRSDARAPRFLQQGIGSLVCVPLINNDHLLGTMTIASPEPSAPDPRRDEALRAFADQAALTLGKTVQAAAMRAQARELGALLEANRALTSSLEPTQVLEHIVASIRTVIACEDAIIYAFEEHANALQKVAGLGLRTDNLGSVRIAVDDRLSLAAWVAHNRQARLHAPGVGEVGRVTNTFLGGDKLSLLCVPLISKDSLRGVIMLGRLAPFHQSELATMRHLSDAIAAALENASLYQTARAEREQQAAVYASASDAIAVLDAGTSLAEVNGAFAELVGVPADTLLGMRFPDAIERRAIAPEALCGEHGAIMRALQDGYADSHVECAFVDTTRAVERPFDAGAQRRHLDFSVTPIMGQMGRRVLLVGRDVTAQREMDLMKANFLSMVSHELRAPLQTINGYLDITLSGMAGALSDQQQTFLRRARAGSEHLTALVDDLLLLSRTDAGQFTISRHEIDLAKILTNAVEEVEITAEDSGVRLALDVSASLPKVVADGPRVTQVLRNLISNAIKFTPEGGTVTVSAEVTSARLTLRVQDTGIGIAPEHQEKVFGRFYQVGEGVPRGRAQGHGLGLAIVRIIVEGHGGSVRVASAPHGGSVFTVELPLDGQVGAPAEA